ncbi:transcription/translation regulatory transformer protein RfaH [Alloalcanivorax gelatiniphagus]|uniref:Transcription antitermination protein RfaH n=2 Tax=Alloalcanivorax gelatiniphagus TaxID=1194167 RepID=A0ABY2XPM4_9GAMM|nr:transcription/translation regulatory transformer protein RfaH [Alloalcanivorax gelatiniphagus]
MARFALSFCGNCAVNGIVRPAGHTHLWKQGMSSNAWYVVQCRANQNFRAQENLENQGFTCFQPCLRVEKLRAGRRTHRTEPLFPGYLFVQFQDYGPSWHTVRSTRGVNRLVAFGDQPARVPDSVVDALIQGAVNDSDDADTRPAIRAGDRLRIENGPFANLEATFQAYDGEQRAIVLLEMLHKQHRLNLALKDVRPLAARH